MLRVTVNPGAAIHQVSHCWLRTLCVCALTSALNVAAANDGEDRVPRLESGLPDLQGYWTNVTQTPIERPRELGDQLVLSEVEAMALTDQARQAEASRQQDLDPDRPAPEQGGSIGQEADINFNPTYENVLKVRGEYRSSMIVDPPDGRFPFRDRARELDIYGQRQAQGLDPSAGPEGRTAGDRCLSRGIPPLMVTPYNANFQIVQTPDYVMLRGEMDGARIIRVDGEPLPVNFPSWLGDSTGYWDGDTLVVHSRNFRPEISHFRLISSAQLELTERFELISADEIVYTVTVNDPVIYAQPFTEQLTLRRLPAGSYPLEYACHEGNYSLTGILAGARRESVASELSVPEN